MGPPAGLQRLHPRLVTGRELLRRARQGRADLAPTGLAALDEALGGGLPRGRLVEIVGRRSSGRFATLLAVLAAATAGGEAAALVDLGDHLDPRDAIAAGVELPRLLWVRPHRLEQALLGAEMLLHTGFPVVVADLGTPPVPGGRGTEASWVRLAHAAAQHRAVLLVSTPYRATGTAAAAVLESRLTRAAWRGAGRAPRLLTGLECALGSPAAELPRRHAGGAAVHAAGAR